MGTTHLPARDSQQTPQAPTGNPSAGNATDLGCNAAWAGRLAALSAVTRTPPPSQVAGAAAHSAAEEAANANPPLPGYEGLGPVTIPDLQPVTPVPVGPLRTLGHGSAVPCSSAPVVPARPRRAVRRQDGSSSNSTQTARQPPAAPSALAPPISIEPGVHPSSTNPNSATPTANLQNAEAPTNTSAVLRGGGRRFTGIIERDARNRAQGISLAEDFGSSSIGRSGGARDLGQLSLPSTTIQAGTYRNSDGRNESGITMASRTVAYENNNIRGTGVGVRAEGPNVNAGATTNEEMSQIGTQLTTAGVSASAGTGDERLRFGLSSGVGFAARLHHSDRDNDGCQSYGVGVDVGPVSLDLQSELTWLGHTCTPRRPPPDPNLPQPRIYPTVGAQIAIPDDIGTDSPATAQMPSPRHVIQGPEINIVGNPNRRRHR